MRQLLSNETDASDLQPEKQPEPIARTFCGITIDPNEMHKLNDSEPICLSWQSASHETDESNLQE
jgi:hypothetical protein